MANIQIYRSGRDSHIKLMDFVTFYGAFYFMQMNCLFRHPVGLNPRKANLILLLQLEIGSRAEWKL